MADNNSLSAPEALVLMSLPHFTAQKALKVGLLELLARGVLRIEQRERPGLLRTRRTVHILPAPGAAMPQSSVAASLLRVARAAAANGGAMTDLVKQSTREYGRGFYGFVNRCVAPALVARGLAEQRHTRLLLIPVTRFHCTPAGAAEAARLESTMRDVRAIPDYLDRDPAQAVALAAAAGTAILLADELRPHYQKLAAAMHPQSSEGGDAGGDLSFDWSRSGTGDDGPGAIDFGQWDFSAFDSIDACLGAFDASFDSSSGGDGGGDGGGGDGGGSSGC